MSLKSRVGESAGPYKEHVTRELVEAFARAIGAPISNEAPPTYLTRFRQGEFELLTRLGIHLSQILHGEQEYAYIRPLRVSETVSYETRVANLYEKRGATGHMIFVVFETEVRVAEERIATCRSNMIRREALRA